MNTMDRNDAELVAESLAGSRDAFRAIVERYQTLICSLAYNATGNLTQSEDVAQETFLTAWKELRTLREPERLRSWLCGIVRNRVHRSVRTDSRQATANALTLDVVNEMPTLEEAPSEQAVSREEKAILWRSLEKIPELYREPLILFYREHQSIEHVAVELDLTDDAVKQRLSRGRKLLQDEVEAFVQNTLRRTAPGQTFSVGVLAALPLAAGPAVTGLGVGAKSTAAAKSGFLATCLTSLLPFLGIAAGAGAQCLLIRDGTADPRLRARKMAEVILYWIMVIGVAWAGEISVHWLCDHKHWSSQWRFSAVAIYWWVYTMAIMTWMCMLEGRGITLQMTSNTAGNAATSPAKPLSAGLLATAVIGAHMAIFTALIRIAWNHDDPVGALVLAGTVAFLCALAFLRLHGKSGAEAAAASRGHFGICFLVILMALNMRIDVWVASAYGVTVAEAWHLQPLWIVPVLSLGLILWTAFLTVLLKAKGREWS